MPGGLETTPIDELTGLPLPILTVGTDFYPRFGENRLRDYHHHFHPENSDELGRPNDGQVIDKKLKLEGLAVRYSRGQLVPRFLHQRYHDIFLGPPLPTNREQKFTTTVLACAGIVPTRAIDLSHTDSYTERDLSIKQHEFIAKRIFFEGMYRENYKNRRNKIGTFFAEYVLDQALADIVKTSVIEEFLHTEDIVRRRELGNFILGHAIDASVANLIPIHREAKKAGMITRRKTDLRHVVRKFFTKPKFRDYYDPLAEKAALALTE